MVKEVTGGTSPRSAFGVPDICFEKLGNVFFCPITKSPVGTNYWTTLKLKTSKESLQRFLDLCVKETIKKREKYTLQTKIQISEKYREKETRFILLIMSSSS